MEHFSEGYPEVRPLYTSATYFLDFDVPEVHNFAIDAIGSTKNTRTKATRLFYAVRDKIRYDPYSISMDKKIYKASSLIKAGQGFCLPKANLLASAARAVNIPSCIGLSDVKNHLCTPRLKRMMGGKELFLHHGYALLYIEDKWVKAAPAFNIELCEKFGVIPTEFDGESDALFQQFDARNQLHIEYVRHHGVWSDFPFERVAKDFKEYYPLSVYDEDARVKVDAALGSPNSTFENENLKQRTGC